MVSGRLDKSGLYTCKVVHQHDVRLRVLIHIPCIHTKECETYTRTPTTVVRMKINAGDIKLAKSSPARGLAKRHSTRNLPQSLRQSDNLLRCITQLYGGMQGRDISSWVAKVDHLGMPFPNVPLCDLGDSFDPIGTESGLRRQGGESNFVSLTIFAPLNRREPFHLPFFLI